MKIILIDTNIYLRFYDSNQKVFKKLLDYLLTIETKIFVTKQIVDEVERNKLNVFEKSIANYKSKIKIESILLPEHFAMDTDNFNIVDWNTKRKELESKNLLLGQELDNFFTENLKKINSSTDNVSLKLKSIFKNQIKESEDQLIRAKLRKEKGNPPGKQNDSLGDQITWELFLDKMETAEEIWIISNDFDYFTRYNRINYLNAYLQTELNVKNPKIIINCFNELSEGIESYFEKNPHDNFTKNEEFEEIKKEEKLNNRFPVNSSNIASIGYDEDTQTLEIEFLNGAIYRYFDVPTDIFKNLTSSESHGRYFAQEIKNHYKFLKVS